MILTDLAHFAVQRRKSTSQWLRWHGDVLINLKRQTRPGAVWWSDMSYSRRRGVVCMAA